MLRLHEGDGTASMGPSMSIDGVANDEHQSEIRATSLQWGRR